MTSFLQTKNWQNFQEALGRSTFHKESGSSNRAKDKGWSYLAVKEHGTLNSRLYTPYGPVASSLSELSSAISSLTTLARQQKVTFLRIEPQLPISPDQLKKLGFTPVNYQQLQPAHTRIIDLAPSEEEILANMSQNSRNITRNYAKKGVTITTSHKPEDITILTSLLAGVAKRNSIQTHTEAYFRTMATSLLPSGAATLYVAKYDNKPIAAALMLDSDDTRIYAHAAASDKYRKLNAGTAITGKSICDAKKAGLKYYDLYGVSGSDDPNHPWAGFTRFKKSFGGQDISYPGAWDLPINKPAYYLYRTYQTIYRKLR